MPVTDEIDTWLAAAGAVSAPIPEVIPVQNPDGSMSSEKTISVEVDELNGGRITLLPSIVAGQQLSDEEAIRHALRSGLQYPSFDSHEEANAFAAARSKRGGATSQGFLGQATPEPVEPIDDWLAAAGGSATTQVGPQAATIDDWLHEQLGESQSPAEFRERYITESMPDGGVTQRVLDAASNFAREALTVPADITKAIAVLGTEISDSLVWRAAVGHDPGLVPEAYAEDFAIYRAAEAFDDYMNERLPPDPRFREEWLANQIPSALGQTTALLASGAVSKFPTVAVALTGAAIEAQAQYETATPEMGATKADRQTAFWLGGLVGTTEIAGEPLAALRRLRRVDRATDGKFADSFGEVVRRIGREALIAAPREAAQEAMQQLGSNAIIRTYNKERDLFDDVIKAGTIGGIIGSIIGGGVAVVRVSMDAELVRKARSKIESGMLLTDDGARAVRRVDDEAADAFSANEQPSRADARELAGKIGEPGLRSLTSPQRQQMAALLRKTKEQEAEQTIADEEPGVPAATPETPLSEIATFKEFVEQQGEQWDDLDARRELRPAYLGHAAALSGENQHAADFPVAEQAQEETQTPPGALGAVTPGAREGLSRGTKPADLGYWPSEEVKDRTTAARGVKPLNLAQKVARAATKAWHVSTRSHEHLPARDPFFASAREYANLLGNIPFRVSDEVTRTIGSIIDPMSRENFTLFNDAIVVRNQLHALDRGEPLRFGFENRQQVEQTVERIEASVAKRPAVQSALETRQGIVDELVGNLVDRNLLPTGTREQALDYYHQQVLMYLEADRLVTAARGAARPRGRRYGFQKKRVAGPEQMGPEYDYNTFYIEAEMRWMIDAHTNIVKHDLFREYVAQPYDKKPELLQQAAIMRDTGADVTWEQLLKTLERPHRVWQPKPGRALYQAITIPDKIHEQIMAGEIETALAELTEQLEAEDVEKVLRTVLALGQPNWQVVIPEEVAAQLDQIERESNLKSDPISSFAVRSLNLWKQWTLLNPKRVGPYNIRNTTGDVDPVIGGAIGTFKDVPSAVKELHGLYRGGPDFSMSPELRLARDLGVISSSLTTQEIPDVESLNVFRRFYSGKQNLAGMPYRALKEYFRLVRDFTTFRENIMRYASFRYYLRKLGDGSLRHYGGARKSTVDALRESQGDGVAAAHMARNLIGDYGDLTVAGQWLRSHLLPFWSFQEINLKRYPRMFINSMTIGDIKGMATAPAALAYRMLTASRIATLFAATIAFNKLLWPEKEASLGNYDKQNPHLLICRNPDGSINVFRNFGAFGELMEWFGINSLVGLWDAYKQGELTGGELATEMVKDPINKVIQAVRPELKTGPEIVFGQSVFPDAASALVEGKPLRTIDRDEAFANMFGLLDEWRATKGALLAQGDRARPNYAQRVLVGVSDPRQNALFEMYDLRERFLRREGKTIQNFRGDESFSKMRRAVMNDDTEAFEEAHAAYLDKGKDAGNFIGSLRNLDPIASRLNDADEWRFEQKFLSGRQRQKLQVARDYAGDLRVKMWNWWLAAFE
jgi:hypothetical protein